MSLRNPGRIALVTVALMGAVGAHAQQPTAPATSPATAVAPAAKVAAEVTPLPTAAPKQTMVPNAAPPAPHAVAGDVETGLAAVYSNKLHGRATANGERYDRNKLTTAHKTLPFGTLVRVTNVKNKKSVVLRVNDRGPTQAGRVVDISPKAAKALGMSTRGMAEVTVTVLKPAGKRLEKKASR